MTRQEDPAESADGTAGLLAGVRVLDMATVIAGPAVAKYLADFGADVIKIEPPWGDPARRLGWTAPGETDSYYWRIVNRGKRSVVLNLKTREGVRHARRLIDSSQILVENMRPGKLEALGLGPQLLRETNPRLIVVRVTGFGQDGPYSGRPGFATVAEAMSGLSDLLGEEQGPPLLPPIAITDEVAGIVGAFCSVLALRHADRTGEGQTVDVSLLESVFQMMGPLPSAYAHLNYLQPRMGSGLPWTVPRGTYRCADGRWVAVSASADTVAARLLSVLGLDGDERFATAAARQENRGLLEDLVTEWMKARVSTEVIALLEAADAAIAPVYSMRDLFDDPHVAARHMLIDVGGMTMQNVVARLDRTPGRIRGRAPTIGEHTDDVLAELRDALDDVDPDRDTRKRPS